MARQPCLGICRERGIRKRASKGYAEIICYSHSPCMYVQFHACVWHTRFTYVHAALPSLLSHTSHLTGTHHLSSLRHSLAQIRATSCPSTSTLIAPYPIPGIWQGMSGSHPPPCQARLFTQIWSLPSQLGALSLYTLPSVRSYFTAASIPRCAPHPFLQDTGGSPPSRSSTSPLLPAREVGDTL